jgi:hypothetical protein
MVVVENQTNIKLTFEKPQINTNREEEKKKELKIISDLLTGICEESINNKDINSKIIKSFLSKKIPSISIYNFLDRLVKYSRIQNSTLMLILIYIDRLCDINYVNLTFYNIHKLILASMIVAIKFNEDNYFSNSFYAKVGGVTKKEIDKLEYEFLSLIDFTLFIDEEIFEKYNNYLIEAPKDIEYEEIEEIGLENI